MDKIQAGQSAAQGRDTLPSMPMDGRRLLADGQGRQWESASGAGVKGQQVLELVLGQWRTAGLAGALSLLVLAGGWLFLRSAGNDWLWAPQWWLTAALLLGLAGGAGWKLSRRRVVSPFRLWRWRLGAALWGAIALLIWGLAFGHGLTLPWNEQSALLLSGVALAIAMLLAATAHWLPGLLLAWAALLGGQLWATPADTASTGHLIPVLGFDLVLLAIAMVLGQAVRHAAVRVVAERMSRRELADLKAQITTQSERLNAETGYRHDVEQALNQARTAADMANRAKTEFLATMSHEVRTPLNGIVPILEMLRETRLDETQREFLDTAYNSARHLLRIINDVLDFAKAESGKLELESIEIDLRELIGSVTDLMGKSAERRGLRLHYKVAEDVPRRVRGDPIRLRQVLSNLVSNAIKFTQKGEIRVEVHKRRVSRKEVELVFSVSDTGAGMTRDTQRRLFRAFSQADASTTRKHGGTGLGLVICKRLVELMGGRIGVKSQPGQGSTFWFVLPMRKSASDVPPARRDLAGLRVLTLVDDREMQEKLGTALADWRMSEERVLNPMAAVEKLRSSAQLGKSWSYELLVVSQSGPWQSFKGLLDEVRGEPALADLRVIALTPSSQVLRELQKQAGVFAMQSPVDFRALQRQLFRLFDVEGTRVKSDEDTEALFDSLALDFDPGTLSADVAHPVVRGEVVARALLVEDNPVNLSVARRMLAKLGIDTLVARDGREALDMIGAEKVDMVLMDCQMPNMDGYEATRRIRAAEEGADPPRHLPVIAMTANVMTGDREKCLAVGMDDYLGKPLEFTPLRRALEPWVRLRQPGDTRRHSRGLSYAGGEEPHGLDGPPTPPAAPAAGSEATAKAGPLDIAKLNELRELMGDELWRLIGQFLDNAPQQLTELAQAMRAQDLDAMVLPAHSLKSSSANLGASRLSRLAARLEHAARGGESESSQRLAHKLEAEFKAVDTALRQLSAGGAAA